MRPLEAIIYAGPHEIDAQGIVVEPVHRGEGGAVRSKIHVQVFEFRTPVAGECVLDARTGRPARTILSNEVSRSERTGYDKTLGLHVARFDMAPGKATGSEQQPVIRNEADASPDSRKPIERTVEVSGTRSACDVDAARNVSPREIPLDAEQPVWCDLPVVPDLKVVNRAPVVRIYAVTSS
jgi:hypothetical protein